MKNVIMSGLILILIIVSACNQFKQENSASKLEPATHAGSIILENETYRLKIDTINGLNPYSVYDKKNNVVLANSDYYYGFGRPGKVKMKITESPDGGKEFSFTGLTDSLIVIHTFVFPKGQKWFEEYLILKNVGNKIMNLSLSQSNLRHGFNSFIGDSDNDKVLAQNWRFLAVPFLINTNSGNREEYKIKDFIAATPREIASEGWIMTNDKAGILVVKYSQQQMEYAIVNNSLPSSDSSIKISSANIIWGGSGMYRGDPEIATNILPNQTLQLGLSRYTSFSGHWKNGFYLFRGFMDEKGHRFPETFNPPVHWNELFDNPLWWNGADTPEKRARFYQLEDMKKEADKAAEIGCEALYLDPGWDTRIGTSIWADDRLMSGREFCDLMREKYNLKVSLHTPLAIWNDQRDYPKSAIKSFKFNDLAEFSGGNPLKGNNYLCSGSPEWLRIKLDRLLKLASDGIVYFMFDGSNYTGPCEVKEHGHPIPYTREEHIRNYARLAEKVHEKFPEVLIEMHDQVVGPSSERYVPIYYTHDSMTFDEIWACEYMWDPLNDLVVTGSKFITNRRAISLYYYNLAYNIPLYLHINLKTDNVNALAFWWYASTCRHLGIGGKYGVKGASPESVKDWGYLGIGEENTPPPEIWQAHLKAMKTYMRLKPFFVRGDFYGIDEFTHIHTLPKINSSVINCFNLEKTAIRKDFSCDLSEIGLKPSADWEVKGVDNWKIIDNKLRVSIEIPSQGMQLIEITAKK